MTDFDFSYEDVSRIIALSKEKIETNEKYLLLSKGVLKRFWEAQINHKILFAIILPVDLLDLIDFKTFENTFNSQIQPLLTNSNFIRIDEKGKATFSDSIDWNREKIKEKLRFESETNYVFFFGVNGITRFSNGNEMDDVNIFYTPEEFSLYSMKKDISHIEEVINEYASKHIVKPINSTIFFANEAELNQLKPEFHKMNILRNRPEDLMQDHLYEYLQEHMKGTFSKENELDCSKRRADIYFDNRGDFYFIEIKWLGCSVNDKGNDITKFTDTRARDGVIQALEYIAELTETTEKSLRCGYLLIFDARDDKKEIDFNDYKFIPHRLVKYHKQFKLLRTIPLSKKYVV